MDVREKLVELIRSGRRKAEDICNRNDDCERCDIADPDGNCKALCIADHLIANGVTVQEWISVKDRLPVLHIDDYEEPDGSRVQFEISEDQWVFTASGHKTKARYETGVVFQGWVGDYGETIRDVTHWMPLPEPPKGE